VDAYSSFRVEISSAGAPEISTLFQLGEGAILPPPLNPQKV